MKAPEELGSEPDTEMPPPSSADGVDTVCQVLEIWCDGAQCLRSGPQLGAEGQPFPVLTWIETLVCEWGQQGSRLLSGRLLTGTQDWLLQRPVGDIQARGRPVRVFSTFP